MTRVVVAGVVNVTLAHAVDSFPVPYLPAQHRTGGLSVRLSGTGWTGATTLSALGSQVAFATYVGADGLGLLAALGLRARGWYGPATLVCAEQPRSLVVYDREGARAGTTDLRSLSELRYPPEVFRGLLDSARPEVAMLNSTPFTGALVQVAIDRGIPVATDLHRICDAGYPPKQEWMRATAVVACSHERLPHGPLTWIESLWQRFATPVALVGCGADGAVVGTYDSRSVWHVGPSTPRGVRYTNGAGDTLLAAFVHHRGVEDPPGAARRAVLAAGWQVGAHPDEEFGLSAAELVRIASAHGLPVVRRLR